jgi:hypothetical protein
MKPDTRTAMYDLIRQVRENIPFDLPETDFCADSCKGCSIKLLEYLRSEIEGWEERLEQGEIPDFGDINQLAKSSRKIHDVLKENGLVG